MDLEALVYPDLGMLCIQGSGSRRPICLKSLPALFGFVAGWIFERGSLRVAYLKLFLWALRDSGFILKIMAGLLSYGKDCCFYSVL